MVSSDGVPFSAGLTAVGYEAIISGSLFAVKRPFEIRKENGRNGADHKTNSWRSGSTASTT